MASGYVPTWMDYMHGFALAFDPLPRPVAPMFSSDEKSQIGDMTALVMDHQEATAYIDAKHTRYIFDNSTNSVNYGSDSKFKSEHSKTIKVG